ncbi:MAG: hydroxyacylglutathione hydrolase [Gammaproteobacteria bacterium]|nr:hydroxyacylglutathione hydrolase [Gammaproteobacteria bacterium]
MTEPRLQVHMFGCLRDNYCYLVHDTDSGLTGVVDTPAVAAIMQALDETGWRLDFILNTHHHWDHAGGNLELKQQTGCKVVGPRADAGRIPGIDIEVGEGDVFELGSSGAIVYDTPGHTSGHIVYHFTDAGVAFVGDTLFSLGCGRLFEGTAGQMWASLSKLRDRLPDETLIYCAHEYTQGNARFALTVEPDNPDLQARARQIDELRDRGEPTVPSTMGAEKAANPFLRPDSPALQATLGLTGSDVVAVFAETRRRKDRF